jgi:hypothetical protein
MMSATVSMSKVKGKDYFDGYYSSITSTRPVPEGQGRTLSDLPAGVRACRTPARGCYRHARLLKFHVCRDAAVCTVHADGFFSVWKGVCSRNWGRPISWPDPLAIASSAARVR